MCRRRICESSVSRHLQHLFPFGNGREWTRPTLSLIGLPWGRSPHRCGLSRIFFMPAKRTKNTLSVLIVQIRIRYHLNLQRVYFYFCIVIITTK